MTKIDLNRFQHPADQEEALPKVPLSSSHNSVLHREPSVISEFQQISSSSPVKRGLIGSIPVTQKPFRLFNSLTQRVGTSSESIIGETRLRVDSVSSGKNYQIQSTNQTVLKMNDLQLRFVSINLFSFNLTDIDLSCNRISALPP